MTQPRPSFSVISPVYGAASLLPELVERITATVSAITDDFEILLVEDHSPDESWEVIMSLAAVNPRVKGVSLSRNFGQQNAINAGLDLARGEWIVTLDCDLQDAPEFISDLYQKALEGYDLVFASRKNRKDPWLKKIASGAFNRVLGYLSETDVDPTVANFVLYHHKVVEAMKRMGDYYRYYPMINRWVGFRSAKIEVQHHERKDNRRSSYSFRKRVVLAVMTILSFSDKPLRMVMKAGFWMVLAMTVIAVVLVIRYLVMGTVVSGWLSIFISIWFLAGILIMIMGVIGLYLGKIFETVKQRPNYIIREQTDGNE
ncbi:MAG: glycosyltransferase [Bacteroidales bacterium]